MKLRILENTAALFSAISLAATMNSPAAAPKSPAASPAPAVVEAKPVLSVFVLPHNPQEGRDPFYPKSMRPYNSVSPVITTNAAPMTIVADLKLKALSGSTDRRLALVNNHTFEAGEEAEVVTSNGRMRVRCIEIRPDSVLMQVGPERRELHLKGVL